MYKHFSAKSLFMALSSSFIFFAPLGVYGQQPPKEMTCLGALDLDADQINVLAKLTKAEINAVTSLSSFQLNELSTLDKDTIKNINKLSPEAKQALRSTPDEKQALISSLNSAEKEAVNSSLNALSLTTTQIRVFSTLNKEQLDAVNVLTKNEIGYLLQITHENMQRIHNLPENAANQSLVDAQKSNIADSTAFSKFSITGGTDNTLVNAHIATAMAPAFLDTNKDNPTHIWNDIGFDMSSAVPASTSTIDGYARQAILTRHGGIINLYASLAGRNPCSSIYADKNSPRYDTIDHFYFNNNPIDPKELLGYGTFGIGLRMIKTTLEGNAYAGMGTIYLGAGIDSPIFGTNGTTGAGFFSLEGYYSLNAVNPHSLDTIFGTNNAPNMIQAVGVKLNIGLSGQFSISLDYSKGIGSHYVQSNIQDVTMLTFGYNKATTTTKEAPKSPSK